MPEHNKLIGHTMFAERLADGKHLSLVVLDTKNVQRLRHYATTGKEKTKVEPSPGLLSAHILPP